MEARSRDFGHCCEMYADVTDNHICSRYYLTDGPISDDKVIATNSQRIISFPLLWRAFECSKFVRESLQRKSMSRAPRYGSHRKSAWRRRSHTQARNMVPRKSMAPHASEWWSCTSITLGRAEITRKLFRVALTPPCTAGA